MEAEYYKNKYGDKIRDINKKSFIRKGNDLFFNRRPVTSEFYGLADVPFKYLVTIRFTNHLKRVKSELERREFLNDLIFNLNRELKKNHPYIKSGNRTVNYFATDEYGESDEVHLHILIQIHPEVFELVKIEVADWFDDLRDVNSWGVESVDVQDVYNVAGAVGYVTKLEDGRRKEFKKFYCSVGFMKKIVKFYR